MLHPRILGIDDAPFERDVQKSVPVIGVLYRGNQFLEGLVATKVRQDGWDSTKKLLELIREGRFGNQIEAVLLKGVAVGGFNVVDVKTLAEKLRKPVIVVMRKRPDLEAVHKALGNLPSPKKRWDLVQRAGEIVAVDRLFCQLHGIGVKEAQKLLRVTTARGTLPEALRVAHIIASGLARGESRGRA